MAAKKILPDVPAMWYGEPSAVCYIGSVMRLMEYIGDPVEQDELFALSGAGLCFPWRFASSCDEIGIIPEIPTRTFEAFGYQSEYLIDKAIADKSICLGKIKQSIDSGRPVIGFGITTSMPMSCLIVGYDEYGLFTRSYWPPHGEQHPSEEYFYSTDWYEKCAGILMIGQKVGERLTGVAAYARIAEWASKFHSYNVSVKAEGKEIYVNQQAFDAMIQWLLDDNQWQKPIEGEKEQYFKQCGLLLLQYYRNNLYEYLKKLDSGYPGVVNQAVFTAIERMNKAVPGARTSDLWLYEAVDPALKDFSAMSERWLRKKVVEYVRLLKEYDNSVLRTLCMPDCFEITTTGL